MGLILFFKKKLHWNFQQHPSFAFLVNKNHNPKIRGGKNPEKLELRKNPGTGEENSCSGKILEQGEGIPALESPWHKLHFGFLWRELNTQRVKTPKFW